ncbi:MAG: M50 family metallopeptidase [Pirellulaceae bacterium]
MNRFHRILLITSAGLLAWLGMQAVHELGHVLGAWATGGTVERVVLHPLAISRTDLGHNPQPLVVAWAGPVVGILLPLGMWICLALARAPLAWLARFFAGFCCLANGLYIGAGSLQKVGDAGDLLRHGSPIALLWLFGLAVAPAGLAIWNGLGRHFGFGGDAPPISKAVAWGCAAALVATAAAMALVSALSESVGGPLS